jgi:hypothetical protein
MVRRGAMEVRAGLRPVQRRSDGGPRGPVEIEFRHEKQGMAKAVCTPADYVYQRESGSPNFSYR